jgi:hypothetical protein
VVSGLNISSNKGCVHFTEVGSVRANIPISRASWVLSREFIGQEPGPRIPNPRVANHTQQRDRLILNSIGDPLYESMCPGYM